MITSLNALNVEGCFFTGNVGSTGYIDFEIETYGKSNAFNLSVVYGMKTYGITSLSIGVPFGISASYGVGYEEISKNFTFLPNGLEKNYADLLEHVTPNITVNNWGTDWIEYKYTNTTDYPFDLYADISNSNPTSFRGHLLPGQSKTVKYNNLLTGTSYFTYANFNQLTVSSIYATTSPGGGGTVEPWTIEDSLFE